MLPKGVRAFHGSSWMEGLGFNLCVAPTDSLGPSISYDLLVGDQGLGLEGEYGYDLSQYQN